MYILLRIVNTFCCAEFNVRILIYIISYTIVYQIYITNSYQTQRRPEIIPLSSGRCMLSIFPYLLRTFIWYLRLCSLQTFITIQFLEVLYILSTQTEICHGRLWQRHNWWWSTRWCRTSWPAWWPWWCYVMLWPSVRRSVIVWSPLSPIKLAFLNAAHHNCPLICHWLAVPEKP